MIVYRPQERVAQSRGLLDELVSLVSGNAATLDLLIRFGEFEAGVMDAIAPGMDWDSEQGRALRAAARLLGKWYASGNDDRRDFREALDRVARRDLPPVITVSVPEGYAYYGLDPQSYAAAARSFASECRSEHVCVIGIRSIGTSLSAVVAGTLESCGIGATTWTVRPHGHPFERRLQVSEDLRREWASTANVFAIVDEGPGLSGSSFVAVVNALRECGVEQRRIVIFPSWVGDAGRFVNSEARTAWPALRKYVGPASAVPGCASTLDLSAGLWREHLFPGLEAPAVQPQHEARKYLGDGVFYKWAGLGEYGYRRLRRAEILANAGHSPEAGGISAGFIAYARLSGRPMARQDVCAEFLDHAADYVSFRGRNFDSPARSVSFEQLLEMITFNTGGLIQREELEEYRREFEDRPAIHIDNRMMPHEWLAVADGWIKTDSVDHSCDHFFPGEADPAWDLAALAAEFRLDPSGKDFLLEKYRARSHDGVSPDLLHFYEVAYLAFRIGYCGMARDATSGTPEGERFSALRSGYEVLLKDRLAAEVSRWRAIA